MKQRDHGLLAGVGDVDAGETHALGGRQELGQAVDTDAELLEVDETVDVAESVLVGFALVHRRRQRGLNRRSDQADQERGVTPRVGHLRFVPKPLEAPGLALTSVSVSSATVSSLARLEAIPAQARL